MNIREVSWSVWMILLAAFLTACGGAQSTTTPTTQAPAATPTAPATAAPGGTYQPVSLEVCQDVQRAASQALNAEFKLQADSPFTDTLSGETGRGCTLTATGNGTNFSNPLQVVSDLKNVLAGWEEQPEYQADGPTETSSAFARDKGLMFVSAGWQPGPAVQCPADVPISQCNIGPEQQMYTVRIQMAQK